MMDEEVQRVSEAVQRNIMIQTQRTCRQSRQKMSKMSNISEHREIRKISHVSERFHPAAFSWKALGLEVAG